MTVYTETEVLDALRLLLKDHGLSWDEFIRLGEADELGELDLDLDFAFRALVPSFRNPVATTG